ncbi:AMP-binding protein [Streptosporangium lutulentum]
MVDVSGSLTYGEVDRLANRLARHLVAAGVRPDEPVGMLVDRHRGLVPALLGVLRAGGAFMPLDPVYPGDRLAYMLETAARASCWPTASTPIGSPARWSCPTCWPPGPTSPWRSTSPPVTSRM